LDWNLVLKDREGTALFDNSSVTAKNYHFGVSKSELGTISCPHGCLRDGAVGVAKLSDEKYYAFFKPKIAGP
jgi:hypothetical protein